MGKAVAQLDRVAIVGHDHVVLLDANLLGDLGMQREVAELAVYRHEELGPDQVQHQLQLLAAGVPRSVDPIARRVKDPRPMLVAVVDGARDQLLVAGIGVAERMTVSPDFSFTCGCSWAAMRVSAESGSPWLPLERMTSRSSGSLLMSWTLIRMSPGI